MNITTAADVAALTMEAVVADIQAREEAEAAADWTLGLYAAAAEVEDADEDAETVADLREACREMAGEVADLQDALTYQDAKLEEARELYRTMAAEIKGQAAALEQARALYREMAAKLAAK